MPGKKKGWFVISGSAFDADAQAFIDAVGTLNVTQQTAINDLVVGLKADSLWTKMIAIYPFVGGTASAHKWNLVDPRDLNAAYRLTYSGNVIHSSSGARSGSSSMSDYCDTHLNGLSVLTLNSTHMSYYSNTDNAVGNPDMGLYTSTGPAVMTFLYVNFSSAVYYTDATRFSAPAYATGSNGGYTKGYVIGTRTASNLTNVFWNNVKKTASTGASVANSNSNVKILTNGYNGGAGHPLRECAFATIGDGLTDADASNLYERVLTFQDAIGRLVTDSDAQAFIDAAGITDYVQKVAINDLVAGLKTDGLWTKMKAIYPFVGGTASTHKWNLKDPRDLDAAFRLTFNGGWTHDSNGVTGDGSTGYAETNFVPNTELSGDSAHISIYVRTVPTTVTNPVEISTIDVRYYLAVKYGNYFGDVNQQFISNIEDNTLNASGNNSPSTGFYVTNRNNATHKRQSYYNSISSKITELTAAATTSYPTNEVIISKGSVSSEYSNRNIAFISLGDGLANETEVGELEQRVKTFQTALSRNI